MTATAADRIPVTRPALDETDLAGVNDVLRSGMLVQGEQVRLFEEELAQHLDVPHVVAVSNCTAALHIALLGLGVGPGDLVIVTPYSWVATANVIELCGATPVFSDIDIDTMNLSAVALEATLERLADTGETERLKAIMPVHTFGNTAGYESIQSIADRIEIPVIEDAACALGATVGARAAGTIGYAGCYSFHPRKIITTGEGGALVTADEKLADFARAHRNHGQSWNGTSVVIDQPGGNYRLTDFQGALGRSQLRRLPELCASRAQLAANYDDALPALGFQPQTRSSGAVVQSYVALVPVGHRAATVVETLRADGVEATIGTNAIPFLDFYRDTYGVPADELPATSIAGERAITIPLFPGMTDGQQHRVLRCLEAGVR